MQAAENMSQYTPLASVTDKTEKCIAQICQYPFGNVVIVKLVEFEASHECPASQFKIPNSVIGVGCMNADVIYFRTLDKQYQYRVTPFPQLDGLSLPIVEVEDTTADLRSCVNNVEHATAELSNGIHRSIAYHTKKCRLTTKDLEQSLTALTYLADEINNHVVSNAEGDRLVSVNYFQTQRNDEKKMELHVKMLKNARHVGDLQQLNAQLESIHQQLLTLLAQTQACVSGGEQMLPLVTALPHQ
jgi:hypothetical protein